MKEKYHELAGEGITYILRPAHYRSHEEPRFQITGFQLDGQETVFALDPALELYNGLSIVNAEAFVRKHLQEEVDRQLEQRAKEEPDLLIKLARKDPSLLAPLLSIAGRERPSAPQFWLSWDRLDEGIVGIDHHMESFQFDMKANRFCQKDGAPLSAPLYELLDPVGYWRQVAVKQREAGVECAGYAELARINSFLDRCHTVHVLLRDEREFTFMDYSITAGDLFCCSKENGVALKDSSDLIPRLDEQIPIEEVQTLLHGRNMLDVDTAAIRELFGELPIQTAQQAPLTPGQSM